MAVNKKNYGTATAAAANVDAGHCSSSINNISTAMFDLDADEMPLVIQYQTSLDLDSSAEQQLSHDYSRSTVVLVCLSYVIAAANEYWLVNWLSLDLINFPTKDNNT